MNLKCKCLFFPLVNVSNPKILFFFGINFDWNHFVEYAVNQQQTVFGGRSQGTGHGELGQSLPFA